jgi:hypothetical protein
MILLKLMGRLVEGGRPFHAKDRPPRLASPSTTHPPGRHLMLSVAGRSRVPQTHNLMRLGRLRNNNLELSFDPKRQRMSLGRQGRLTHGLSCERPAHQPRRSHREGGLASRETR